MSNGSGNYSFQWSDNGSGTNSRTDLSAGFYTITVTDNGPSGCIDTLELFLENVLDNRAEINILQSSRLVESCTGAADAFVEWDITLSANFNAPATVRLLDAAGLEVQPDNLSPGDYCIEVRDAGNCVAASSCFFVSPAAPLAISGVATPEFCQDRGTINLEVSGGTGRYTYDWQDLSGTVNIRDRSDLPADNYIVIINDENGCNVGPVSFAVADSCDICPLADERRLQVVVGAEKTVCFELEDCFSPSNTSYELLNGGQNGISAFGFWNLDAQGCLSYGANTMSGTGVDTICILANDNNLQDTLCLIVDILSTPPPSLAIDTIYFTTEPITPVEICLTTAALPTPFALTQLIYPPVNATGQLIIDPVDSCVTYIPQPGALGQYIDTMAVQLCDVSLICDTFILIASVVDSNCDSLIQEESILTSTGDCDLGAEICLDRALFNDANYGWTIDGSPFSPGLKLCDTIFELNAQLGSLLNSIPNGPYELVEWVVDGDTFRVRSFADLQELVDLMTLWDPAAGWTLGNNVISGNQTGSIYSDLLIRDSARQELPIPVPISIIPIPQGGILQVDTGSHIIVIQDLMTSCTDTLEVEVLCVDCVDFYSGPDTLMADNCDGNVELCLNLQSGTVLDSLSIFDNGNLYTSTFTPCGFDSSYLYRIGTVPLGNINLEEWTTPTDTLRNFGFSDLLLIW